MAYGLHIGERLEDASFEITEHAILEDFLLLDGEVNLGNIDFILVELVKVRVV